jgi:carbon storage regulator
MLVLSRKQGEKIILGNGVTVTVVSIKGNAVRLGIEAPEDVRILREELAWWRDQPAEPFQANEAKTSACREEAVTR